MTYIVQLASILATALINYIAKNSDTCLDKIFGLVGGLICKKVGNTAAIIVQTNSEVAVEFDVGDKEIIKKISDSSGHVEFKKNLKKGDTVTITAYGEGYIKDKTEIVIDNESVTYCVVLKLRKEI